MIPKTELRKTKEFWIEIIGNELSRELNALGEESSRCDAIAEKIVDDEFMEQILAVKQAVPLVDIAIKADGRSHDL